MSQGVNKVTIIGNLGRDPEVRYAQSGTAICNLSVAVGYRKKVGDGWEDAVEWVRVSCFGKTAESAGQYLQKGRQVYVEGRLQTREYEKDGEKRYSTEVVADQVLFLGGKGSDAGDKPAAKPNGAQKPAQAPGDGFADESLPF